MPIILDNPIINSYVQGLSMRRQQEQTEFERGQKKEESARAEKQLQGYLAHLQAEKDHQHAELDLQKQQVGMQEKSHRLEAQKYLQEMISTGKYDPNGKVPDQVKVGGQIQNSQTPGGLDPTYGVQDLPTNQQSIQPTLTSIRSPQPAPVEIAPGVMMNPAGLKSNQDLFAQHLSQLQQSEQVETPLAASKAGAIKMAEANAELPAQKELLEIKNKQAIDLANVTADRAREVANINGTSRIAAAKISAEARRYAANVGNAVNPDVVGNNALLHAVGQGGVALGNNKQDVATKLILSKMGYVDLSGKDSSKLKDVHGLDTLYDTMSDFVKNLPEGGVNAVGQKLIAKIPATDLKLFEDRVRGMSGNISKQIGGESGRLSEDDIKRAMGLLVSPGITKEQALEKLQFFGATTRSKVMDQILGGMSQKQKLLILHTYNFDPTKFDEGVKYNGKLVHQFERNPNNPDEWGVFNPKTGKVESLGK